MRDELLNRLLACICTEKRDVSDYGWGVMFKTGAKTGGSVQRM